MWTFTKSSPVDAIRAPPFCTAASTDASVRRTLPLKRGVGFLLVVVTTRSYYLGPVLVYQGVSIAAGIVVLLLVAVACVAFVECCLLRPLRATQAELKLALSGAPVGVRSRRRVVLSEVQELEGVCNTLRCRLDEIRSYMPDRFNAKFAAAGRRAALRSESEFGGGILGESAGDEMRHVACSVAYVYYTPRTVRNPTNAVVELMMQAVVGDRPRTVAGASKCSAPTSA
ncbi:protein kinase [Trypanosoma conorhini]|uniref:Protein kinase n=1 Tax=Trypanosoma conorhini TaxID=83891 RepID=A0A422N8J8_9TRYP|nr:protein kinase [Trypanosoma conorhini]RNF01794.1 protein kinase [Trypanosoma conorhini]